MWTYSRALSSMWHIIRSIASLKLVKRPWKAHRPGERPTMLGSFHQRLPFVNGLKSLRGMPMTLAARTSTRLYSINSDANTRSQPSTQDACQQSKLYSAALPMLGPNALSANYPLTQCVLTRCPYRLGWLSTPCSIAAGTTALLWTPRSPWLTWRQVKQYSQSFLALIARKCERHCAAWWPNRA